MEKGSGVAAWDGTWLVDLAMDIPDVRSYKEAIGLIDRLVALEQALRVATDREIEQLIAGLDAMGEDVRTQLIVMALAGVRLDAALGGLRRLFNERRSDSFRGAILYGLTRRQPHDRHFESHRSRAWLDRVHRFARQEVDDLSQLYEGRYPDESEIIELTRGVMIIHDRRGRAFQVYSGLPPLLADEGTIEPAPSLREFLREVLEQELAEELLLYASAPLRDNQYPAEDDAHVLVALVDRPGTTELLRRQVMFAMDKYPRCLRGIHFLRDLARAQPTSGGDFEICVRHIAQSPLAEATAAMTELYLATDHAGKREQILNTLAKRTSDKVASLNFLEERFLDSLEPAGRRALAARCYLDLADEAKARGMEARLQQWGIQRADLWAQPGAGFK